jgi:hypothetical protein
MRQLLARASRGQLLRGRMLPGLACRGGSWQDGQDAGTRAKPRDGGMNAVLCAARGCAAGHGLSPRPVPRSERARRAGACPAVPADRAVLRLMLQAGGIDGPGLSCP